MTDRLKERLLMQRPAREVSLDRRGAVVLVDSKDETVYLNPDGPEALARITQLEAALSDAIDLMEQMGLSTMEHRAALHQGDRKP